MSGLKPTTRKPYLMARKIGANGTQKQLWTKQMYSSKVSTKMVGESSAEKDGWYLLEKFGGKKTATPPEAQKSSPVVIETASEDLYKIEKSIVANETDDVTAKQLIDLVASKKWQVPNYRKLSRTDLLGAVQERLLGSDVVVARNEDKAAKDAEQLASAQAEINKLNAEMAEFKKMKAEMEAVKEKEEKAAAKKQASKEKRAATLAAKKAKKELVNA